MARSMIWWRICLLLIRFLPLDARPACHHVPPTRSQVVYNVHIEPDHVLRKRSLDQPMRIHLHYDESVLSLKSSDSQKYDLIHSVVFPAAVSYWERALRVRQTAAPIRLNRQCKSESVSFRQGDPHPYCHGACEAVTMCGEVAVPEEHLELCRVCDNTIYPTTCRINGSNPGPGVENADFVLYVSAMQTQRCNKSNVVAYASHCQQEAALDRPIAGHANLCPDLISTKMQALETLISTVKHEMVHALGFSVSLYAFFRDKDGSPLTPRYDSNKPPYNHAKQIHEWSDRIIKEFTRPQWQVRHRSIAKTVHMMVTPRVREEARRHFNCSTLEGAELEDQGGEGTELTHWEKRLFENEAMTGTHTQNAVYSRITLALLEDTGWYLPNYDMAEQLTWGKELGCLFAKSSCKEWMDRRKFRGEPIAPFCDEVKRRHPRTTCMENRHAVALCNLVEHTKDLPLEYQNFDDIPDVSASYVGRYGGSVDLADYCPYFQEFSWNFQNTVLRGSQCMYEENNPKYEQNFALEEYGRGSRCFDHGKNMWEEHNCHESHIWQHRGSGCYQYKCENGRLHIQVLDHSYECFYRGQQIHVQLLLKGWLRTGTVICPPCDELCSEQGMKCLQDSQIKAVPLKQYHRDTLTCCSSALSISWLLISITSLCRVVCSL